MIFNVCIERQNRKTLQKRIMPIKMIPSLIEFVVYHEHLEDNMLSLFLEGIYYVGNRVYIRIMSFLLIKLNHTDIKYVIIHTENKTGVI